ncbi:MAG TPA: protein-arginine deiminase family protein [Pirellulales bacterium]|jgi:autotransporter-associated beta strand protein|nr:protein-arginine deiminase family protein [Pirellulales bacterium]
MMDLSGDYNLTGIIHDGSTFTGGLDGNGLALSDHYLTGTITWAGGASFNIGAVASNNVVQAAGQDLNVTLGQYSQLEILATAVGGSQAGATFTVNYTDGSSTQFMHGISNWTSGGAYGEPFLFTMPYVNKSDGTETTGSNYYVYGYSFTVDPTKTVSSITLPNNSQVMVLAVTGIALARTPTNVAATPAAPSTIRLSWTAANGDNGFFGQVTGYNVYRGQSAGAESTTPLNGSAPLRNTATNFDDTTVVPGNTYYYLVQAIGYYYGPGPLSSEASAATPSPSPVTQTDLSSAFNLAGIVANGAMFSNSGGLDGSGHAISSTLLQQANLGFLVGQAGQNDVVKASGQTITLPPGEFTQVQLLAASVGTASTTGQQFTVNYADGTFDTFTRDMSKWTAPQNYSGESVALALGQANTSSGGTVSGTYDLYSYTFNLASAKTVASITLPNNSSVMVLGINCQTANLLPIGTALTIDPGAMLDLNGTNQQIGSLSGTGGDIVLANSTLTVGNGSNTTFAGTFDGNGGVTKVGSGTLTLFGANTYSGVTTVSNGTLQFGAADAFSPNSSYAVTAPGQIGLNGFPKPIALAPTNLAGTFAGGSEIDLTWTAAPYLVGYQVQYQAVGQSTWTNFGGPLVATSVHVTGLSASTQYAFRVAATDAFGDVLNSATTICSTTSSSTQDPAPIIFYPPYTYDNYTHQIDEPVTGTYVQVYAPSANGAGPFTYAWSATSVPLGANVPTFSSTGTGNNGPYTIATFSQAGAYTLQAIVTDAQGLTAASSVTLTVQQTVSSISLPPATVSAGASRKLIAIGKDQFGKLMSPRPSFTWSVAGGSANGSVDSSGVYTAPAVVITDSTDIVRATAPGGVSAVATVTVPAAMDVYKVKIIDGPINDSGSGSISDNLSVTDSNWFTASSWQDAVTKTAHGISGTDTISGTAAGQPFSKTFSFPGDLNDPGFEGYRLNPLNQDPTTGTETATITLLHDQNSNGFQYHWDISVQAETQPVPKPNLDDSTAQALSNIDPGTVILTSDPSQDPTGNADSAHLAELDINVTAPAAPQGVTLPSYSSWTVTLSSPNGGSSTKFWGDLGKTDPLGSQQTWNLNSDGSLPNTVVYAEEITDGTYTIQLAIADGSGKQQGSTTAVVTAIKVNLDELVDTNRDNKITSADESNKDSWKSGAGNSGAIVLPDAVNANGGNAPDDWVGGTWAGQTVNAPKTLGAGDAKYIVPLQIKKFGVAKLPPDLVVTLAISNVPTNTGAYNPPPAEKSIRIFDSINAGANEIIGPSTTASHRFDGQGLAPSDDVFAGNGNVTFGIQGIAPGALIEITLTASAAGNQIGVDKLQIKVAPFVLNNQTSTVIVGGTDKTAFAQTATAQLGGAASLLAALANKYGNNLGTDPGTDKWEQDGYEIGYAQAPSGQVPLVLELPRAQGQSAIQANNDNSLQRFVESTILQRDVGVIRPFTIAPGNGFDSGGDIESLPKSTGGPGYFLYGAGLSDQIRDFFKAQDVNSTLPLNTNWLDVGHVDEVVSAAPDGKRLIVADPELAYGLLLWAQKLNPNAQMLQGMDTDILGQAGTTVATVLASPALRELNLGTNPLLGDVLDPANLPSDIGAVENQMGVAAPAASATHTGNATLKKVGAFTAFMNNPLPVTYTVTFTDNNGDYQLHGTGFGYDTGNMHNDEVFPDQYAFVLKNWWSGTPNAGNTFTYSVNPASNVVAMPVLFRKLNGKAVAVTSDFVNSLFDGSSVIAGMGFGPSVNWSGAGASDILQSYAYWAFGSAGLSRSREVFVDARAYHNLQGFVHCATNVIRQIPAKKWWET